MTGRRGRRRRKLLDDLKGRGGYAHLKEEALDRTMWRARFGRGFRPVLRQTTKRNEYIYIYMDALTSNYRYIVSACMSCLLPVLTNFLTYQCLHFSVVPVITYCVHYQYLHIIS